MKASKADFAVAVKFVADEVEIVLAARDRQIFAPPVLDPFEFDIASLLERADAVGTRAERRLERGLVERPRRVISFREDRQRCREQRHVEPALGGENRKMTVCLSSATTSASSRNTEE